MYQEGDCSISGSDFNLLRKMDLAEVFFLPNIWQACEFAPNSLISSRHVAFHWSS